MPYDYRVFTKPMTDHDGLEATLSSHGAQGYRAVSIYPTGTMVHVVMERDLPQTSSAEPKERREACSAAYSCNPY